MLFRRCPGRCVQKTTYTEEYSDIQSEASVKKTREKAALVHDPNTTVPVNRCRAKKYIKVSDLETDQSYL